MAVVVMAAGGLGCDGTEFDSLSQGAASVIKTQRRKEENRELVRFSRVQGALSQHRYHCSISGLSPVSGLSVTSSDYEVVGLRTFLRRHCNPSV